ncbi:MAG: hypothetical protein DRR08_14790 [Candidatus Parabeggiatoa sp. nov. 2]|nr:MAG: hypothetical protein B6247_11495 [Beggiatoa sp. 4572_84]RKZ59056.1 MAG: hypothetical protein DRR08_14790 [Gammaproteobacteria bacterium]
MMTFEQTLDTVMQLPQEQRKILINIVIRRDNEFRRHEIAKEAREAIAEFHAGNLKPQSAKDLISKLRQEQVET